ncbi:twin-arginine translocase TatA/TatE family subunit (plasmid) [Coraliomargarita sp. W4R53]
MLQGLTGWHFLIILAVILLLFGAAKLPALAKSMGQSARVFKGEMKAMKDEEVPAATDKVATGTAASVEATPTEVRSDSAGSPDTKS